MTAPHSPELIRIKLLRAKELKLAGFRIHQIARELGISDTTLYNWSNRQEMSKSASGYELADLRRENRRLRRLVASLSKLAAGSKKRHASQLDRK